MNKRFERSFRNDLFPHLEASNIVRELFRLWTLPGQTAPSGQSQALRLAVRGGSLNFYVSGQSVALIDAGKRGIFIKLHKKYFDGVMKGSGKDTQGTDYEKLSGDKLDHPDPAKLVAGWVDCAHSYSGAEKKFVEALVSCNSNVIDMEMALPGDDAFLNMNGKKIAPRMDIVTLVEKDNNLCLNFWEVKCAENGELRATAEIGVADLYDKIDPVKQSGAAVAGQLQRYMKWLGLADRMPQVSQAYINESKILIKLAEIFNKDLTSAAYQTWARLAQMETETLVVRRPGIVICNYGKYKGSKNKGSFISREVRALSFVGKHRDRLTSLGITVLEIDRIDQCHVLPSLQDWDL